MSKTMLINEIFELIDNKKFVKATLDKDIKFFVI